MWAPLSSQWQFCAPRNILGVLGGDSERRAEQAGRAGKDGMTKRRGVEDFEVEGGRRARRDLR